MSKFFEALEVAERERALRRLPPRQETGPTEVPSRRPASSTEGAPAARTPAAGFASAPADSAPQTEGRVGGAKRAAQGAAGERPAVVEEHLVSLLAPTSFEAEQYRSLRYVVEQMHKRSGLSIVAVTSAAAGDGKTTTAINLAGALAQAPDDRVLLVEADVRRPSVTLGDLLGLGDSGAPGLVDVVLKPGMALENAVQRHPRFNLSVLLAGWRPTAPYEVLRSPRLGELLAEARQRYDYIILDTPPLLVVPDSRVIGKWVDGFLVVVAANKTPRKLLAEALNVLEPAKVIGLVFNGDRRPLSGYYGYYASYGQLPARDSASGWGRAVRRLGGSLWRRNSARQYWER